MECGLKRKLDCIADMEVLIHPHTDPRDFEEQTKKMRLSVQFSTSAPIRAMDDRSEASTSSLADWGWRDRRQDLLQDQDRHSTGMDTDMLDDKGDHDHEHDQDDIPSTSEVINSLRKVILWMSAQGDHNDDYIQYLSEVEKYAKSKQFDVAQQRKITEYLIRRDH